MLRHAEYSPALEDAIKVQGAADLSEIVDLCTTAGGGCPNQYRPEMVDRGVGLALAARDYAPDAKIFWAVDETDDETDDRYAYFVFGKDEADAVRRFRERLEEKK